MCVYHVCLQVVYGLMNFFYLFFRDRQDKYVGNISAGEG
jgi:hypothetical protein